ncbi:MAG: glycosyltransferase family 1 protein [Aeromicrobium sp.]
MKVVVDAMSADFGGIRTYVEHLLARWSTSYPEDELHVLVDQDSTLDSSSHVRHQLRVIRPRMLGRPLAQSTAMRKLVSDLAADVTIATIPSTGVRRLASPLAVVVHDLRHELRPEQFTRGRRLIRRISYRRTYALADGFLAVSQRSLDDLHMLHPSTAQKPAAVTHHGADHVLAWSLTSEAGPCVAFAHHTNKNPDLILDAWAVLARRGGDVPDLLMVGVSSTSRVTLEAKIEQRALGQYVTLAPYLPDQDFQTAFASAAVIVFPSDFEGFGLPVVEAMTLGTPVVIGPEKATMEVANGHAVVMTDWTPESLAEAMTSAAHLSTEQLRSAQAWGRTFTWERTVRETRDMLVRLIQSRS